MRVPRERCKRPGWTSLPKGAHSTVVATKRRLPVVQAPAEPEGPPRPPWQWAVLAVGLIVLGWLVLALVTSPLSNVILRRHVGPWGSPDELAARIRDAAPSVLAQVTLENALLQGLVLALACFLAGMVVGTWGPRRGVAESAGAGAFVSTGVVAMASMTGGLSSSDASSVLVWGIPILVPLASGAAALGAWRGSRTKRVLIGP